MGNIGEMLPIIVPLVVIQFALLVAALYDLSRPDRRVRGNNKALWAILVVFASLVGPAAYFIVGREEA